MGKTGRALLQAIVMGETDPHKLAYITFGRLKSTREERAEALHGRITDHHRYMIRLHLIQIEAIEAMIADIENQLEEACRPFEQKVRILTTIPGISEVLATTIIAEIGVDMTRFPTAGHLVSWAGLCPRMDESAGKRRSTRIRHGDPWLKTALLQAAWAASHTKCTYLNAQFVRLRFRRGPKKAAVAVAASILTAIYHMLKNNTKYVDPGHDYFDKYRPQKTVKRLLGRLRQLGVEIDRSALVIPPVTPPLVS